MSVRTPNVDESTENRPSTSEPANDNRPSGIGLTDAERSAQETVPKEAEGMVLPPHHKNNVASLGPFYVSGSTGAAVASGAKAATQAAAAGAATGAAAAAASTADDAAEAVADAVLSTPRVEPPEGAAAPANAPVEKLLEIHKEADE